MKVLLAGDWHGNTHWAAKCARLARDCGVEQIIQLGDFGFVWSSSDPDARLRALTNTVKQFGDIRVAFLPGNHENHEQLELWTEQYGDVRTGPLGGYVLTDRVEYLGRAARFELGGRSFATLGGAVSIDKGHRTPFVSWWPTEVTTLGDLEQLGPEPADVFLSHDAPANAALQEALNSTNWHLSAKLEGESLENRELVRLAVDAIQPRLAVHGHFHHPYEAVIRYGERATRVVGLGCDGQRKSVMILDLDTLETEVVP